MLIDINAYVGHWPFSQLRYNTCEALLDRMNEFGVEVSAVSNLNGIFYKNTQSANEELDKEIRSDRRFRNRFIPFAVLNPIYAGWKDDLETCCTKMSIKGIRLYPMYHDYLLTDPSCIELVKRARDRGLTVAFTLRMVDKRASSWMDLDQEWFLKDIFPIIKEVPDAKYLILNVANMSKLTDEEERLIKNTNIVFDTSGRSITNPGELIHTFGKDKFAFGTHSPILDYLTGLLRIESLRENEASEEMKNLVRFGNAKKILGI